MNTLKACIFAAALPIALDVYAYTPRASSNTVGMFLSGSGYEIPSAYFFKETLTKYEGGSDNYVLKSLPSNLSSDANEITRAMWDVKLTSQWQASALNQSLYNPDWYKEYNPGFPSLTEKYSEYRGQCVAFAKAMTGDTNGTKSWKAGVNVISLAHTFPLSDHTGKMIAFFGTNVEKGVGYPQGDSTRPGHVGIFLKYEYKLMPPRLTPMPIGFWIADENYEGNAQMTNPDGKIRKHLILINPIANAKGLKGAATYASQYWFVDIL
jgi:hypothetical protein